MSAARTPAVATALTPEEVELILGDPTDPANAYGYAAAVARDEADAFPEELCGLLFEAGFHLAYLPREWGGTFESFDRSLTLVRAAARRDVTVMPGTMFSIIAATCLQVHGSLGQREKVARVLREGGAVAFAMTEAAHGSDLVSGALHLDAQGRLQGEKWLVGNGTRCEAVYVVARTGERGPGAFTAYLIDTPRGADPDGLTRLPAPRTDGMRGVDLATLRFDGLTVPPDAQVGKEGEGLEVALRAQQAVRLMSMAGSLGIADTALRLTLDFVATRRFGRATLDATPYARRECATASAALLAADAVALAAARGAHVTPQACSVWGPAAKHLVAEATQDVLRHCSTVLATRSVLRGQAPGDGVFQKLRRDAAVVRVIDASPYANLRSYAAQLPTLVAATAAGGPAPSVDAVFALDAPLPAYEPARLDLLVRGADPVLAALPAVTADLAEETDAETAALLAELTSAVAALPALATRTRGADADPHALADLGESYAWLHGAAACVQLWAASRTTGLYGAEPGDTGWLRAVLAYLLSRAAGTDPRRRAADLEPARTTVGALHTAHALFTALPVPLAAPQETTHAQG
ncbi:acyl-CoA/acyl-ACP dehydrogenase [Streptomyces sp. NBC_01335]|uniref:acyl-CoA dehydrogenase family protein n=1 Tax=Streptomyces sp. NBC_01335 TaxID=2903828 RepID=UPI002E0E8D8F|nr:acyl-CoA/acyl-ACP dehydrogenase [Streptomyces sp. NBC_01335]